MITARMCMQPEGAPCGTYNCGRTGECDPSTGRRACNEPEAPCEPGSTESCSNDEGTGVRTCNNSCSFERECRITERVCSGDPGAPCGMWSCGRTGDCDPMTGERACTVPDNACEPGSSVDCETNAGRGRRFCGQDCRYSDLCQVPEMMCEQEQGVPCGMWGCGRTGTCNTTTGQRACNMPDDACEPGTGLPCETSEGSGTQFCGQDCRRSDECTITARTCSEPENAACGRYQCGRTGECNRDTGQRACNEPPEPCEPGTIGNCTVTVDGGTSAGLRVCSNACEWGGCEILTVE